MYGLVSSQYARENQERFLGELKDLLRIPSVSTAPEHKEDVRRAAEYVANGLRNIGMENVEIISTERHPLIYADWLHAPGKPTVLCYAHYDVQPPDPLDEWKSPPFEPTERDRNLYARGAVDDKGQLWMEVKAIEALMRAHGGKLPLNVKFIVEGEEEVGSPTFEALLRAERARLACDLVVVSDTGMLAVDLPSTCVAMRGLVGFDVAREFLNRAIVERHADAMIEKPCGLLSDPQIASDFARTDSVLAVHDEPQRSKPLIET